MGTDVLGKMGCHIFATYLNTAPSGTVVTVDHSEGAVLTNVAFEFLVFHHREFTNVRADHWKVHTFWPVVC